jgi:hypothetical protein
MKDVNSVTRTVGEATSLWILEDISEKVMQFNGS